MWGFLGGKSRKTENEGELGYWWANLYTLKWERIFEKLFM